MNILKTLLFIGDPLLVAFMASVLVGAVIKNKTGIIAIKYASSFVAFLLYFLLYAYGIFAFKGVWTYVIMFVPWVFLLIFIIAAVIIAPKGNIKNELKEDYKLSGYDTAFPNDIDNDNNYKR
jgi:hypothetical protein